MATFTITQNCTYSYTSSGLVSSTTGSIYTNTDSTVPSWLSVGLTNNLTGIIPTNGGWSYYYITATGQYEFVFTNQPTTYGFTIVSNGGCGGTSNNSTGGGGGGNGQIYNKTYASNTSETIEVNIYPIDNSLNTYNSTYSDSQGSLSVLSGEIGGNYSGNDGGNGGNGGGYPTVQTSANGGVLFGGGGGGGGNESSGYTAGSGGIGGYGLNPNSFISTSGTNGLSGSDGRYGGFTICQCGDGTTILINAGMGGHDEYGFSGFPACILLYVA
jgi:hypothetical protein